MLASEMFSAMDKNRDAILSRAEMHSILTSPPAKEKGIDAASFYDKLDSNGDGKLQLVEAQPYFVSIIVEGNPSLLEAEMKTLAGSAQNKDEI